MTVLYFLACALIGASAIASFVAVCLGAGWLYFRFIERRKPWIHADYFFVGFFGLALVFTVAVLCTMIGYGILGGGAR